MDSNWAPHKHVLRPLSNLSIYAQKVGFLKRFEAEEVVLEIAWVVDDFIYALKVFFNDIVDIFCEKRSLSSLLISIVSKLVGDS